MKYRIYVHRSRPKVTSNDITKIFKGIGISPSSRDPDIAIIVGGDGTFGYFGRKLEIPMIFVGVMDSNPIGSKASLAEIFLDQLHHGITKIEEGKYYIEKRGLISVDCCGRSEDVFTDVYLERGNFGGCLRYSVSVNIRKNKYNEFGFTDYAIGNGVIICTATGSSGYYSSHSPKGSCQERYYPINLNLPIISWGSVILLRILCHELRRGKNFQNIGNQKFNIRSLCNLKLN
jgi:NAD kinase